MKCKDVHSGTYSCSYGIDLPYLHSSSFVENDEPKYKGVSIDKCLIYEVLKLWENGIKTTGCCCGHGNKDLAYIGVQDESIPKMKELGYSVIKNTFRPNSEDTFKPKTKLEYYDEINKGFHRWD